MPQSTSRNDAPAAARPERRVQAAVRQYGVLGCLALTAGLALIGYALFGCAPCQRIPVQEDVKPVPPSPPTRESARPSLLFEPFSVN